MKRMTESEWRKHPYHDRFTGIHDPALAGKPNILEYDPATGGTGLVEVELVPDPPRIRVVRLPGGRLVSLAAYVKAWKKAKTLDPDATIKGWNWYPVTVREVLADMRRGMMDRINSGTPASVRGL